MKRAVKVVQQQGVICQSGNNVLKFADLTLCSRFDLI